LEVVIAGGGIGGLELVLALGELAGPLVRTTLVTPRTELQIPALRTMATFTHRGSPSVSVRDVVSRSGAKLRRTVIRRVVADRHEVLLGGGQTLSYDALVLAIGARRVPAYAHGVITYGLEREADDLESALADAVNGLVESIAFVVPPGVAWSLPLYELALMSAHRLHARGAGHVRLVLVSPESAPLAIFGPVASAAVRDRLDGARIGLELDAYASIAEPGVLELAPGKHSVRADRIIALPRLEGPALRELPATPDGFIAIDEQGRVTGMPDVWAVGDATAFPVKQGGLACQLADAVAEQLAARAGAAVVPHPYQPVLRGRLLTGDDAQTMTGGGEGGASSQALWEPARKVDGRYLSAFLGPTPGFGPQSGHIDVDISLPARSSGKPLLLDPYSPLAARRRAPEEH
jgi:sulfide:quinone oxidoreductase